MSEDGRSSAGKMMLVGMAEWGLWMSAVRGKKDDKKREEKSQRRGGNGKGGRKHVRLVILRSSGMTAMPRASIGVG